MLSDAADLIEKLDGGVLGRESIQSGNPGNSGDQFVAGRASETFSAKRIKVAALSSEETIPDASWSVWHVEGTVAGADSELGQLVSGIGLAAQKAGRLPLSGIEELEGGIAGNSGVG
jgi:hypothetical protein